MKVKKEMVTISLCMIVKDEEENLGACLDSIKGVVDEIVIVDTGSMDRTKDVARGYTDKVYDFIWIDDFAAARNFSFSKATKDYCMWLDADDIVPENGQKKLLLWKRQANGTEDALMLPYAAGFDEKGKVGFCYYRERILKRERGFRWKGRVHEAIAVYGKVEYLDIIIEHHTKKHKYNNRNLRIYEKMKQENIPFETRDQFYYARELYYHKRYQEAEEGFQEFLKEKNGFSENQVEACRMAAYCCYKLDREEDALGFLLRGLRFRVPKGELCCDIGKHYMDRQIWEQAIFWFQAALNAPKKEKEGGFIEEECYGYIPCIQLSVCYEVIGEREQALKYHDMAGTYKPYGVEYRKNKEYFYPV